MKSQSTKNPVRIIPCGALFESYGQTLDPSKYCPELPEAQCMLAEGVGFEPTIRNYRIPDFESGAFDHSATLPHSGCPKEDRARMIAKERRKEKRRFRRGWSLRREIDAGGKSPVVSEPGFGGEGGIRTHDTVSYLFGIRR